MTLNITSIKPLYEPGTLVCMRAADVSVGDIIITKIQKEWNLAVVSTRVIETGYIAFKYKNVKGEYIRHPEELLRVCAAGDKGEYPL